MKGRIRIAIACTGLLLGAPLGARAQTAFRETGSITVGGYLVWVRGTNAKVVELFVGRGFRDAFAKAHDIDAVRLQQWIDSVRAVQPVPADDSGSSDAQLRGTPLGSDVTMMRRVGGSFSGLRVLVNGEDPIRMAEPTARDFIAMLDSAARVTRELSVPPPSIMASMPIGNTAPQLETPAAPDASVSAATPAPTPKPALETARAPVPAPSPKRTSKPAPAPPPPAPVPAPPAVPATILASTMGASTADAPPELVLEGPSGRVSPVGEAPALSPLPRPVISSPPRVAEVAQVPAPEPAPDTAVAPHIDVPADKLIRTPLGPFTVPAALLSDRDKEAQYCYTQLGLKYNPDLKGEITVKLSLRTDGGVDEAVVTKRNWQGISAGEVEACVRALAHDWTFASNDPSVTDGAKVLTFSFAP